MPKLGGRGIWPPPVYVARFADGTECRMSIWSREGEPLDFERGRKVCCSAVGTERVFDARGKGVSKHAYHSWSGWHPNDMRRLCQPATDLISGHFDQDGKITPDPFFMPEAPPARKKVSALDKLIFSLDRLSPDDLLALSVELDARLGSTAETATL